MPKVCGLGSPEVAPWDDRVGSVLWAWGVWRASRKWRDVGCVRRGPRGSAITRRSPVCSSVRSPVCPVCCVWSLTLKSGFSFLLLTRFARVDKKKKNRLS